MTWTAFSDIAVDMNGYVYVSVSYVNGPASYTDADTILNFPGASGGFIVSFENNGNLRWVVNNSDLSAYNIALATTLSYDGVFAHGNTALYRYNCSGTLLWSKPLSAGALFKGIACNSNGQLAACAVALSNTAVTLDTVSVSTNSSTNDAIIFLADTSGAVLWGRNVYQFAALPWNGSWDYPLGVSSNAEVFAVFNSNWSVATSFVFAGDTLQNPLSPLTEFAGVIKFSASGIPEWARGNLYAVGLTCTLNDIAINNNDDVILAGSVVSAPAMFDLLTAYGGNSGNAASFVGKLNNAGTAVWTKTDSRNGYNTNDEAFSVCNAFNNTYIVAGGFQGGTIYQGCNLMYNASAGSRYLTNISESTDTVPVAVFSFSANGFVYSFTDMSFAATSWHWDFGNGDTSILQSPVYTYPATGTYTVTLTVYFGNCQSSSSQQLVNVSIAEYSAPLGLQLFPNPAANELSVLCNGCMIDECSVLDAAGRILQHTKTPPVSKLQVQTSIFDSGIYFIEVNSGNKKTISKFVKQ